MAGETVANGLRRRVLASYARCRFRQPPVMEFLGCGGIFGSNPCDGIFGPNPCDGIFGSVLHSTARAIRKIPLPERARVAPELFTLDEANNRLDQAVQPGVGVVKRIFQVTCTVVLFAFGRCIFEAILLTVRQLHSLAVLPRIADQHIQVVRGRVVAHGPLHARCQG